MYMYVCVYVCMYVCMYVRMYGCMDAYIFVCTYIIHVRIYVCNTMNVCMYMYVCMYVQDNITLSDDEFIKYAIV